MRRLILVLFLTFFLISCGGNSKNSSFGNILNKALPDSPTDCGNNISIGNIPVLKQTTFPFACAVTRNNPVADKDPWCTQRQFFSLVETFDPNRRDENRDDGADTHYKYFPITRSYFPDSNTYWHVFTEYAVDEIVREQLGGATYTVPGIGRSFHTGEDWNLSNGSDSGEHLYAIGDGIVLYKGVAFGNTIQIVHKLCPNEDEDHDDCEMFVSHYSHMSNDDWNLLQVGDRVNVGQVIGRLGDTGSDGAPHLHFEIRRGDAFLGRVNIDGSNNSNGVCVKRSLSASYWPGLNAAFIRENYEDPTTFIKQNAGIPLLRRHHINGALNSQHFALPQDGIVVIDLKYFPGDDQDIGDVKGDTRYNVVIHEGSSNGDQRLTGNSRRIMSENLGDIRAVIWGERETRLTAGTDFYIETEIVQDANDAANTPYSVSATLYPYRVFVNDDDHTLAKTKRFPTRALFFDEGQAFDGTYRNDDTEEMKRAEWYYSEVKEMYDLGMVGGYGAVANQGCPEEIGQFCPANSINRAEFFQILMNAIAVRYNDSYDMPDGISSNDWFAKAVSAAVELDILDEGDANMDWLSGNLLRKEAARYIARAFVYGQDWAWKISASTNMENPFDDVSRLNADIADILACHYHGVIDGYKEGVQNDPTCNAGDFCADREIIRAEMAAMIKRAINFRLYSYIN